MSDAEQSPGMDRADSEAEEEYAVEEDEEQQSEAGSNADEEEEEQEEGLALLPLFMQHGAHRNWQLREKHHVHKAKGGCPIKDGKELGNLLGSRSGKVWGKVMYNHIDLVGGVPLQGGEEQLAPHVRFLPPEGSPDSDDAQWLRPVHAKVVEFLQPLWLEAINTKFKDEEKRKRVLSYYKPVLDWKPSQLKGPRLDPVAMGTGQRGFLALERQLKSVLVKPPVQPRKTPLEGGEASTSKKQKASSVDTESVDDECPFQSLGPGSRVWCLGEVGRVVVNNSIDGNVYASVLP
jgi:hypothetical protein